MNTGNYNALVVGPDADDALAADTVEKNDPLHIPGDLVHGLLKLPPQEGRIGMESSLQITDLGPVLQGGKDFLEVFSEYTAGNTESFHGM